MIEKIEKLSQFSFTQTNYPESQSALQSYYCNLQTLKKFVNQSLSKDPHSHSLNNRNNDKHSYRKSQSDFKFPEITVTKLGNLQFVNNGHCQLPIRNQSLNRGLSGTYLHNHAKNTVRNSYQTEVKHESRVSALTKKRISELSMKENTKTSPIATNNVLTEKGKKQNRVTNLSIRKPKFQKTVSGLSKNQRFFEEDEVNITQETIEKIGLYEATNIYKYANVKKFLNEGYQNKFKPVINLKFATFTLCSQNEFFLTSNSCTEEHQYDPSKSTQHFINSAANQQQQSIKAESPTKQKVTYSIKQTICQQTQPQHLSIKQSSPKETMCWQLTIRNYRIIKNEHYFALKSETISDWNQITFLLHLIGEYLKKIKISLFSFKFQQSTVTAEIYKCRKIKEQVLQKLLKIRFTGKHQCQKYEQPKAKRKFNSKEEVIREVVRLWRDKRTLKLMKTQKDKQHSVLVWMCLRMIAKRKIRLAKEKALARAELLNSQLKTGDWEYEIEIHIPSFSQLKEVRNTTQYMECYENMFYHMWQCSSRHFVLILPAVNETLLQMLQQRIKLSKNITLICPESHQQYPKSLPLSACLLYCKEGLRKLKTILDGRKGVIFPGRCSHTSFVYQHYLSELLNCPIFAPLHPPTLLSQFKDIWNRHRIPTATYRLLSPQSSLQTVIDQLAQLILLNQTTKIWVFKINEEFNGRGIATFDTQSTKKIKQLLLTSDEFLKEGGTCKLYQKCIQRAKQETKQMIKQYLQIHFRLKLKVNLQSCMLRVQEYIEKLLKKGGIIEEYVQQCETYEFSYNIEPTYSDYSNLYLLNDLQEEKSVSFCQSYEVDFVSKLSTFNHKYNQLPQLLKQFSKNVVNILKQQQYFGFVSVSILFDPKTSQIYATEIKPYMTHNFSMGYFLQMFTNNGLDSMNRRNPNIVNEHTNTECTIKRDFSTNHDNELLYIFIPTIIFTDVDEIARSEIIQHLVMQSWQRDSNLLFNPSALSSNPDRRYGTLYMSLGLSMGLLVYGKHSQAKLMKKEAIAMLREISEIVQSMKLYKGTQQMRDSFQFGDLIRAVTKIK